MIKVSCIVQIKYPLLEQSWNSKIHWIKSNMIISFKNIGNNLVIPQFPLHAKFMDEIKSVSDAKIKIL